MNLTGQSQIDQARLEWAVRLRFSPFPQLEMNRVISELNSFRIGDLSLASRTWEVMIERDADLSANIIKRCEDAAGLEWEIMPDGSREGDRHAAALRYFYDHATVTSALDQDEVGDVSRLVFNLTYAHATRYSIHEMLLRVDNAAAAEVTCEFRLTPNWFFECRRGYLGWLRHLFDVYGQPLKLGEWLPAVGYGHMRACSVLYVIKHQPLSDWLLYCSRYGFPAVQLVTDSPRDSAEWNSLVQSFAGLANDGVLITNKSVEVRPVAVATSSDLPFRALIDEVNRAYAKIFRGSDLATASRARETGAGQAVGASVQAGEKSILLRSDARWATSILNFRVDRAVIRYLFNAEPRAWIKILGPCDDDAQNDLASLQAAVSNGVAIGVKAFRERFNWPEPEPGEQILRPATASVRPHHPDHGVEPSFNGARNSRLDTRSTNDFAPGADPARDPQTVDPGMPGGAKPLTRWNFPEGQENALANEPDTP
jgi:phage gp29-like protein